MNARHPVLAAIGVALVLPAIALANPSSPHGASQAASSSSLHTHVQSQMSQSTGSHWTPVARAPHVRANGQTIQSTGGGTAAPKPANPPGH